MVSSWKFQYGWISNGTSCIWLNQPAFTMVWLNTNHHLVQQLHTVIEFCWLWLVGYRLFLNLDSREYDFSSNGPGLDKQSARLLVEPLIYLTLKSCGSFLIKKCWSLCVACQTLGKHILSGFCSVSS